VREVLMAKKASKKTGKKKTGTRNLSTKDASSVKGGRLRLKMK
jgi:hypothetical protein